jgi:hypothetical protein
MRLAAVGDVTAFHREPESGYEFAAPVLAGVNANVEFCDNQEAEFTMVSATIP